MMEPAQIESIVRSGGGSLRGVQPGYPEHGLEPLVLFDDERGPNPHGSTMGLFVSQLTVEAVAEKIAAKKREFEACARAAGR